MKNYITLLLLFSIAVGTISCGSKVDSEDTETSAESSSAAAETENDEYGYIDPNLPKKDYNGKVFNILYPDWSLYRDYYFADESNGDVVNDAVYERNRRVEEYFNIDFEKYTTGPAVENELPALQKVVAAGLPEYDLVLTHCTTSMTGYVTEGLVYNWNDVPGVDLDKPYWNQSVRENFEVNGVLPFMSSDYILPDVNSIFFNKEMIEKYSLQNPYDLVNSGKWTWDKLREMAAAAASDLNGDGIMNEEDQYGFVGELDWQFCSILTSCDQLFFGKDDDGILTIACDNEKTQLVLEKIAMLLYRDNSSFTWKYSNEYDPNQGGTPPVAFDNNRSLFYLTPLSLSTTFRDVTVDYGIVPLPKYDENQEEYITLNWAGFMCVPSSVEDPECVGLVCEMLAAESCRTTIPAFYNVLLGEKVALEPDAQKMLDIMFENSIYDLGINLGYTSIMYKQLENDSPNNTSYMAQNKAIMEKTIQDYMEGCESYIKTE